MDTYLSNLPELRTSKIKSARFIAGNA